MGKNLDIFHIPEFIEETGYLKPGIHLVTLEQLKNHEILAGTRERRNLIESLEFACKCYHSFGITDIYVNGSFSTSKPIPGDIDCYIEVESGNDERLVNLVNSGSVWGDFARVRIGNNIKFIMWHKYRLEVFIQPKDQTTMFDFFCKSRDGIDRGILKIKL